jgi:hypothetical protein
MSNKPIYLRPSTLYNTGYINRNYNDYFRMKQGLMPQNLASNCFSPPSSVYYNVPVDTMYQCTGPNLYPIHFPNINYGSFPPSDDDLCTMYVQSP